MGKEQACKSGYYIFKNSPHAARHLEEPRDSKGVVNTLPDLMAVRQDPPAEKGL